MSTCNEEHTWEQVFSCKRAAFTLSLCSGKCLVTLCCCAESAATGVSALQGSVLSPWEAAGTCAYVTPCITVGKRLAQFTAVPEML